jgi:hypothetical protein
LKPSRIRQGQLLKRQRSRTVPAGAALLLALALLLAGMGTHLQAAHASGVRPVPGDPLTGNGTVNRALVTYTDLTTTQSPPAPVDDSAFALPSTAAMPRHEFEGSLSLRNTATAGGFSNVTGCESGCGQHLPPVSISFVQNGSYLIPAVQGLVVTGDTYYNYIVSPGRAWTENSDNGWSRASFPFALIDRNQNCVHQGVMMFLFNARSVSTVRYQITHETCELNQWNMWGQLGATYKPRPVPHDLVLKNAEAAQVGSQMRIKPLSALAADYPKAGLDLSAFGSGITGSAMSAYGVVYKGVNYVADGTSPNAGCQTRYGTYAYCHEMELPSYSTAKSAFAGLSMALLRKLYGSSIPNRLLKSYVPEMASSSNWNSAPVTFQDAANMATGNYDSQLYESDEDGATTTRFLDAEPYGTATSGKMGYALDYPNHGDEGYTWVYHTIDHFLLTQAETGFLQSRQGKGADLFHTMVNDVYRPIQLNADTLTTERTDNASAQGSNPTTGRPFGAYGLFWTVDDVAKLATLFQNGGDLHGTQLVDRHLMLAAMQRLSSDAGVAAASSNFGLNGDGTVAAGGYRYSNGLWAYPTTSEVSGCALRIPFMSGFGGITVAMMPNGATYYYFSDANQFSWANTIAELNKLSPMCAPTTTTVTSASPQAAGRPVTFTASVTSADRAWAPTGTVQFQDNGIDMGQHIPLGANGKAAYTARDLPSGKHSITAVYSPDLTGNTGTTSSPARTTLTSSCSATATTCTVASTAGMHVGDTVVMGTATGTDDEHVITALTPTSVSWVGAFQYVSHAAGQAVWVQDTAGGGFAGSTSHGYVQHVK